MFKKVQLKFFGMITAILIAIFIALLSGINIIMDILMERQTRVVLKKVASSVEYNDSTQSFSFTYQHREEHEKPPENKTPEPEKVITSVSSAVTSVTSKTESTAVTTAETTEEITDIPETEEIIPPETSEDEPETLPEETEPLPPETSEEIITEPPAESEPPEQVTEDIVPEIPDNPEEFPPSDFPDWHNNWGRRDDWDRPDDPNQFYEGDRFQHEHEVWGESGFTPMADKKIIPVLDGYTVTDGEKPPEEKHDEPVPKSFDSVDFFVIMADKNNEYIALLNNDDMTEETAQDYITQILNSKETSGMADNYSFCAQPKSNGTIVVLSDRSAEIDMMNKLKRTTVFIGIISIVFLSVGAYFISGLIVRPIKETFEKQKQFISDASHELKTPLTVISANADVLAGEIGGNKWLNYIQSQAERMNVLVNDLLSLTRLENKTADFIQTNFNLSQAITNTALPFECQAFETNKNFVINVEENITVCGSEQHIKQMAGIFIDNALKYSKDGGTVRVSLTKEDGRAVFSVYNTGSGVKESEKYRIFERFYRSDESRNRATGGYGLGLAIAKSIIDKHKFRIEVENEEGKSICFIVKM